MRILAWTLATWVVWAGCAQYEGEDRAPSGDGGAQNPVGAPDGGGTSGNAPVSDGGGRSDGSTAPDPSYAMTDEEQAMLTTINDIRAQAPASPALNPVLWDQPASLELRAWAEGCTLGSAPSPGGTTTIYGPVGATISPTALIQHLGDGRAYYNLADNSCSTTAATCEAYTDLVQRGVSRIACAWGGQCPGPVPGGGPNEPWRKYICRFSPLPDPAQRPF